MTPSRAYLLSVSSRKSCGAAWTAATAASSSPRCAVCAPGAGPAQAPPRGPGAWTAQAAMAIR
eukprot:8690052-Lingulodinium_polyedra.AAC.1